MGRRLKGGNYGNGSDSGPLRKIVGMCSVGGVRMEAYECGHIAMPKSDIIGETNAARRRCRRCKMGRPVHFTGEPPTHMSAAEYDAKGTTPAGARPERGATRTGGGGGDGRQDEIRRPMDRQPGG